MIKLFKKVRQNLLMENLSAKQAGKTGKYLKYAVGEITLVVIGILIALSLNNWNDNQKVAKKEMALLKKVKEENLYNIGFLEEAREGFEDQDKRIYELCNALSQPRNKKVDEQVEDLMLDIIQMGMYFFSTEYLERYINNSENNTSELTISLVGLKDNLLTFQKASEFT